MTYISKAVCRECTEPAIVTNLVIHLCLTHAYDHLCNCGHTAAYCPIIGCGQWVAVDDVCDEILTFDFMHAALLKTRTIH